MANWLAAIPNPFRREDGVALAEVERERRVLGAQVSVLTERLTELEIELEEQGWTRTVDSELERDFTRQALRQITKMARLAFLKNPLIKRAVNLQVYYVWGRGVEIGASLDAVNDVVQSFLDDVGNQTAVTGDDARDDLERELQQAGNLFFALFPNPSTGAVKVRTIPFEEISERITNPDDRSETWYYKREWMGQSVDPQTGILKQSALQTAYYPDWRYEPKEGYPERIGRIEVRTDAVVYHRKAGGLPGGNWGVSEMYAALDWARSYKESLEDDATRSRALARYAYSLTTPGGNRAVQAAKARLGTTFASGTSISNRETNPPPLAGSTFVSSEGVDLEPVKLSGATLPVGHNRALRLMVSSATDTPDTMLSGDSDVGNHATATTMDRPTELAMSKRQAFWGDTLTALINYAVDWAIKAPSGALTAYGTVEVDPETGRQTIVMLPDPDSETGEPYDRHVDVTFPAILERDVVARVAAIVNAFTLGGHPIVIGDLKLATRLLLQALEVDDVDEEMAALFPDDGSGDAGPQAPPADPVTNEVVEAVRSLVSELQQITEVA